MAQNPYLNVLFQSGYYDGATTYFNAKYTMWQIDPSGKMKDRLDFKGYRSGHMMYLRRADLETANEDLRAFITKLIQIFWNRFIYCDGIYRFYFFIVLTENYFYVVVVIGIQLLEYLTITGICQQKPIPENLRCSEEYAGFFKRCYW